ncbi:MAG TPA: hypothetical protein VMU19_11890, partial [Bryobacteraceae bacterium]|nr:hypothetical protein [Bryobacteraceae bacterium]
LGGIRWAGISFRDPRVSMRLLIGALLAANLAAAVLAFKPFGGSAADLREKQSALESQLADLSARVAAARQLVNKVEQARREGDSFLTKYVVDRRVMASSLAEELNRMTKDSGVRQLPQQYGMEDIEGSDSLKMMTITAGCEGTYAGLKKLVEEIDKSPRFLIIESMTVVSPEQTKAQAAQTVNVNLKLDTFVREAGATP